MAVELKAHGKQSAAVSPVPPAHLADTPQYLSTGDLVHSHGPGEHRRWLRWTRRFADLGWCTSLSTALIFSASAAWSAFLVVLNLSPNATADNLMLTGELDNGRFWQFPAPTTAVSVSSTLLLLLVVGLYVHLLLLVLAGPRRPRPPRESQARLRWLLRSAGTIARLASSPSIGEKLPLAALRRRSRPVLARFYTGVLGTDGEYRKIWNVVLELPEVVLQVLAMRTYMRRGLDQPLLYLYASLMAMNALLVAYHVLVAWKQPVHLQILQDAMLDTVFAVFFPALVLVYSVSSFHDDLKAVKILQRFFPPSAHERSGRIFVDARQINTFSAGYESLLLLDSRGMLLQICFNLFTCLRWHRIMRSLLERARLAARRRQFPQHSSESRKQSGPALESLPSSTASVVPLAQPSSEAMSQSKLAGKPVDKPQAPRRAVPAVVGVVFLAFGVACIATAAVAVRDAQAACEPHSSCILVSYVWPPINAPAANGSLLCNCLAFVDRDLAPNASEELPDVTLELAAVARAGSLEVIQLVNRRLNGTLPDEVSACTKLRSLILIYTGVQTLPAWASETFTQLEFLHIQGSTADDKESEPPNDLLALPDGLFSRMRQLSTLHISGHAELKQLSPLESLPKLQTVFLGQLVALEDLPSLSDLPSLQVLALQTIPQARTLPDLSMFESTLDTLVVQDLAVCCSGFLSSGVCDTSFPTCCRSRSLTSSLTSIDNPNAVSLAASAEGVSSNHGHNDAVRRSLIAGSSPQCLDNAADSASLPSNATLAVLERFMAADSGTFCVAELARCYSGQSKNVPEEFSVDMCEGVLYRECSSEAEGDGICYNLELGRVQCVHSESVIAMRRAAIAAGCSCDALEEQWLGC